MNDSPNRIDSQVAGTSFFPGSTPREILKHLPRLYFQLDSRNWAPRWCPRRLVKVQRRTKDANQQKIVRCLCQRVASDTRFVVMINAVQWVGIEDLLSRCAMSCCWS